MDGRAILMIALSLVAGAAGGMGASYVSKQNDPAVATASDNAAVLDELARLRGAIEGGGAAMLRGTDGGSNGVSVGMPDLSAWIDQDGKPVGALAKLLEQVEERVGTTMDAKLETWKSDEVIEVPAGPVKKKMTIDEMARDLKLSVEEEEKLRAALKSAEEDALKLLADKDQSIDDVRREIDEKSKTPEGKAELTTKMGMKVMSNLGGFMGLIMKRQAGIKSALGDKSSAFDNGYRIVDPDFLDFDAFSFGD